MCGGKIQLNNGLASSLSCSVKILWKKWHFDGSFSSSQGQVVDCCWKDRTSLCSFDEYNDACMCPLAQSTVTGNSWQQECSRSLLICLYRAQLHYWLAGFFIQQLPVNKSHSKPPSHPPPLISRDRLLTSMCTRTIVLSPLERVTAAFQKVIFRGTDLQFKVAVWLSVGLFWGSFWGKVLLWPPCLNTLVLLFGGSFLML